MAPVLQKCVFFAIVVLCCVSRGVLTLKIYLDVPDKVAERQTAQLKCNYDLEGEGLETLRWYKDDVMFFRYDPQFSSKVGIQYFSVDGVKLDRKRSTPNSMYNLDIDQSSAGVYACVVTTGPPHFRKGSEKKHMSVEGVLTVISLDVPDKVAVGQSAKLTCDYDLQGEDLYVLRWYKDNVMFFRYDPDLSDGKLFKSVEGVKVNRKKSSPNTMYIKDITPSTAGVYMCEVSTGPPNFRKLTEEKLMSVEVKKPL